MVEVVKAKKMGEIGFGIKRAEELLGMSVRCIWRELKDAKEGKAEIPIPYIQYRPGGRVTFHPPSLLLWQQNRTHGIKPCTKARGIYD